MTDTTAQQQKYQQLIAKCWSDQAFKQCLLTDPVATLRDEGWVIPEGIGIKTYEDTDRLRHIVIPARPAELTDDQLADVAGGILPIIGGVALVAGVYNAVLGSNERPAYDADTLALARQAPDILIP